MKAGGEGVNLTAANHVLMGKIINFIFKFV